jgi:hypothetical protein
MFDAYPETWPLSRSWDRKYRYFGMKRREPKIRYIRGRNSISCPRFIWSEWTKRMNVVTYEFSYNDSTKDT